MGLDIADLLELCFLSASNLHGVLHEKLLTTHMEEARKLEHLKEVTERQQLAEQQILKLEAELREEQRKKEELVIKMSVLNGFCMACPASDPFIL